MMYGQRNYRDFDEFAREELSRSRTHVWSLDELLDDFVSQEGLDLELDGEDGEEADDEDD
jgi:hypothetical protein